MSVVCRALMRELTASVGVYGQLHHCLSWDHTALPQLRRARVKELLMSDADVASLSTCGSSWRLRVPSQGRPKPATTPTPAPVPAMQFDAWLGGVLSVFTG